MSKLPAASSATPDGKFRKALPAGPPSPPYPPYGPAVVAAAVDRSGLPFRDRPAENGFV